MSDDQTPVEKLSPTVSREWLHDRMIVVYRVTNSSRTTADTWYEAFREDLTHWPDDRPFRAMHDFTGGMVASTPYGRMRGQQMVDMRPEISGRVAILLSNSFTAHMIELFLRMQKQTSRVRGVFFDREQAIQWLIRTPELQQGNS